VPPPQAPGAAAQNTSLHAAAQETPRVQQARTASRHVSAALEVRRLQCGDEAGGKLAMTRLYGRAPTGERGLGTAPQHDGENLPMWGARGLQGLQAVMTGNGATAAEVFRPSVMQVLGPMRAPGEIGVQQALARRRVRVRFLPPDSPDWSPMALGVSQLKTALRAAKARTRETLETSIRKALETVTPTKAGTWCNHCGYA
jgi:hypothetical protein